MEKGDLVKWVGHRAFDVASEVIGVVLDVQVTVTGTIAYVYFADGYKEAHPILDLMVIQKG
jgi:hypothetical protein